MEEYRCPVAQANKDAHLKFVEVLRDFRLRQATSAYLAADARELVDTLDRWLAGHICSIDVQLRDRVGSAQAPPTERTGSTT